MRLGVPVALALSTLAGVVAAQPVRDHLECFKVKDPQSLTATAVFDAPDVGMSLGCKLSRAAFHCVPAAKRVLAHDRPALLPIVGQTLATGRLCYKVDCPKPYPAPREETDQFGTHVYGKLKPAMICVPAATGTTPPPVTPLDSLQCFKTRHPAPLRATVELDTALGVETGCKAKRGKLLCVPGSLTVLESSRAVEVVVDGTPSLVSDSVCHVLECPAPHPGDQTVADRFGTRTVAGLAPKLLCAPAQPGPYVSTTTTATTTSTTTTGPPSGDPALDCQRAIERGGMAYAATLLETAAGCAAPGQAQPLDSCLVQPAVQQSLAAARAAWGAQVAPACDDVSVHGDLGYLATCGLAPAPCTFEGSGLDSPGPDDDLLDCLACRVRHGVTKAATALFANRAASTTCHQAIGAGAFEVLRGAVQQARACLDAPGAVSVAACVAPAFQAWRASVLAACGTLNPFTTLGYPNLCAGVAPPGFAACASAVPACNLASVTVLDAGGADDDLLDCLECQTEEGALSVLRTLYGANLCCVNGQCDAVRTRWGCRAAGGSPVHYRIDTVDVGDVSGPHSIDVADDGTLYIADSGYGRIKKRTPDGTVSVVGATPFFPTGVAADAQGNVYVTNRCLHQLRKLTPQGDSSIFAGTGVAGHSGDGGPAVDAQTAAVEGVTVDAAGNVYFTESGFMAFICGGIVNGAERVRMVDPSGTIHTVAGSGNFSFENPNGPALLAGFLVPYGLHIGPSGRIFIGEAAGERVLRFDPVSQSIAWIAGRPLGAIASFSGDAGPALRMRFYENCGADEDQDGNVIVAPMSNNRIVLVDALGSAVVIAGTGAGQGTVEGSPATLTAAICPEDVAVAPDGRIYFPELNFSNSIKVLTRVPF